LALISVYFQWKESKNPLDISLMILVGILFASIIMQFTNSLIDAYAPATEQVPQIGYMSVLELLYLLTGFVYSWFIFYMLDWKRMYAIPLVVSFFAALFYAEHNIREPYLYFNMLAMVISVVVLFYKAFKNRNAVAFAIALCGAFFLTHAIIRNYMGITHLRQIFAIIGVGSVILAENGWFDEHLFYDKKERKKVQNVWVSRVIAK